MCGGVKGRLRDALAEPPAHSSFEAHDSANAGQENWAHMMFLQWWRTDFRGDMSEAKRNESQGLKGTT